MRRGRGRAATAPQRCRPDRHSQRYGARRRRHRRRSSTGRRQAAAVMSVPVAGAKASARSAPSPAHRVAQLRGLGGLRHPAVGPAGASASFSRLNGGMLEISTIAVSGGARGCGDEHRRARARRAGRGRAGARRRGSRRAARAPPRPCSSPRRPRCRPPPRAPGAGRTSPPERRRRQLRGSSPASLGRLADARAVRPAAAASQAVRAQESAATAAASRLSRSTAAFISRIAFVVSDAADGVDRRRAGPGRARRGPCR